MLNAQQKDTRKLKKAENKVVKIIKVKNDERITAYNTPINPSIITKAKVVEVISGYK
jgi:hypothetical protein